MNKDVETLDLIISYLDCREMNLNDEQKNVDFVTSIEKLEGRKREIENVKNYIENLKREREEDYKELKCGECGGYLKPLCIIPLANGNNDDVELECKVCGGMYQKNLEILVLKNLINPDELEEKEF